MHQPPGLGPRNLTCLRTLVAAALFLAGTLDSRWFAILEAPKNADYVLTTRGTAPGVPHHSGTCKKGAIRALIKIAFQCMALMCDALAALSPEHLRICISTLGQFADTNMALTAAVSLFWGISDAIQTKRRELYGATLSPGTWDECLWKVTFPLLDTLSPRRRNALTPPSSPDAAAHADDVDTLASDSSLSSSSGESKLVALQSIGAITSDLLMWKIMDLPKHNASWPPFKSSNGSASASTPATSGPLPPPLANNISIGTTGAGTSTPIHPRFMTTSAITSSPALPTKQQFEQLLGAITSATNNSICNGPNAHCSRMRLPDLAHLLYHCGRNRRGAVGGGSSNMIGTGTGQSRCDDGVFARFSAEAHHYANLYMEHGLHPALFTLQCIASQYVADEKIWGNLPLPRVREEELLYLHKLRELLLWSGSLWAAPSETTSKYAKEQPAVDTSLPPAELIADSVKRSSRAYIFHFFSLLCEIASVPHKAPSAWIFADRLAVLSGVPAEKVKKEMETAASPS
ncbi:hypothetical protein F5888DRAFT_1804548 [Russula emetica]|nr:hypothetical protein F5888DRAFT_1804548 [Russula emetica]